MWQDFSGDSVVISYDKNGEDLGTCFTIEPSELADQPLFPHILTKNCSFECNFGQMVRPFCIYEPQRDDRLRLIGKCVVDFLLVLIELFLLDVTAEALQANIGSLMVSLLVLS